MVKDLSAFAAPTLDLNMGRGRIVHIAPPSAESGAKLAAIVTLASAVAAGDISDSVRSQYNQMLQDMDQEDLDRIAVGGEYDRMVAEGWPSNDIRTVCQYATFYWVFGESTADAILNAEKSDGATPGKARRRGRNGRRTA